MRNDLRTALLTAVIGYLACAPASAQARPAATIRCTQCSLSGQKPDTSAADLAQIKIIEQLKQAFHDGLTIQGEIIASVLYRLAVEKIETIETRLRAQAARTLVVNPSGRPSGAQTSVDPERLADDNIYLGLGADVYLWTTDMFSTLAAVPPTGLTLPPDEYERHKAMYRAIPNYCENGIDLIENGLVFEHVCLCQMEKGVVDDCAVR